MKWEGVLPRWWRLTEPLHRRTALELANGDSRWTRSWCWRSVVCSASRAAWRGCVGAGRRVPLRMRRAAVCGAAVALGCLLGLAWSLWRY